MYDMHQLVECINKSIRSLRTWTLIGLRCQKGQKLYLLINFDVSSN